MNGLDKAGSTPLHWAAHGGHVDCMETLLAVPNCEVNVQVSGWRPGETDPLLSLFSKLLTAHHLHSHDLGLSCPGVFVLGKETGAVASLLCLVRGAVRHIWVPPPHGGQHN